MQKINLDLEQLNNLIKSKLAEDEYLSESEMKEVFGEEFQFQIFTTVNEREEGDNLNLFVYVKNGISQFPISVWNDVHDNTRYYIGTARAKMMTVEQVKHLEKELEECKKLSENLSFILEKQKIRKLFI